MPDQDNLDPPTFGELWRGFRAHVRHDEAWKLEHEDSHRWLYRTVGSLLIAAAIAVLVSAARGQT